MADNKPSFFSSVVSGITGSIKGVLAGGVVGTIAGGVVGAITGLFLGGVGAIPGAIIGAGYGSLLMGTIGAFAGTMTGVVKSREAAAPSANDIVNVAKLSFAQGVSVGQNVGQEQTTFRDKIANERGQAPTQRVH